MDRTAAVICTTPRTVTMRQAITSQTTSVFVAVRSVTRIGSPPRTRSRARKLSPGRTSLTS